MGLANQQLIRTLIRVIILDIITVKPTSEK